MKWNPIFSDLVLDLACNEIDIPYTTLDTLVARSNFGELIWNPIFLQEYLPMILPSLEFHRFFNYSTSLLTLLTTENS